MALEITTHRSQLPRSGMALGGIGTGGMEIRQDGSFQNWSFMNSWPLFGGPRFPYNPKQTLFFMLRVHPQNENQRLVLLQIEDGHSSAAIEGHEFQYMFPWISGVDVIRMKASFPFARLEFEQDGLPLRVEMKAWSPFAPGNVKDSALPMAYFDFDIRSTSERPIEVQVLAIMRNIVGHDQPERAYANRRIRDGKFSAIGIECDNLAPTAPTTGNICLASFDEKSTAYMGWEHHHPYYERLLHESPLPEVNDTDGRNVKSDDGKTVAGTRCFSTISRCETLDKEGDSFQHSFALTWFFPNLYGRLRDKKIKKLRHDEPNPIHDEIEGHYYQNFFESSEAVARYALAEKARLAEETMRFHTTFFDSSLPSFVLDQVNSQMNTFRTSAWLTKTNLFGILEGLSPRQPWAGIATTDVAMYGEIAPALLFPEIDRMTIDAWRKYQADNGIVIHSIIPNSRNIDPNELTGHRLDMPAQFAFMAMRAALWSGDEQYLCAVWENVKRALAYVLRERDMNGDKLPDMEGVMCSYDNFPMYGVAPFVVSQWLAALALALKVAARLGDKKFSEEYEPYFKQGCRTFVEKTWNGKYFNIYSDKQEKDPNGQFGCMVDQLIGLGAADQVGLPTIVEKEIADTALRTIYAMNYRAEQGLRNCQWPSDDFLHPTTADTWVDQANTCWTGVELNFAAQLYYAGLYENAEEIVRNVDERHRKWGMYWDHQEFGGHYFRPMSALAIPNAFLGLSYDGETLRIAPARPLPVGRWCFLFPGGYGTFHRTVAGCRIEIKSGALKVRAIELPIHGKLEGKSDFHCETIGHTTRLVSAKLLTLKSGTSLQIRV